jgi:hypothetical protein
MFRHGLKNNLYDLSIAFLGPVEPLAKFLIEVGTEIKDISKKIVKLEKEGAEIKNNTKKIAECEKGKGLPQPIYQVSPQISSTFRGTHSDSEFVDFWIRSNQ